MDALRIVAPGLTAIVIYQIRNLVAKFDSLETRLAGLEAWRVHHDEMANLRFAAAQHQLDHLKPPKE